MESIIFVMSLMGSIMLLFYWLLRPVAKKYFSVGWKYGILKICMVLFVLPLPDLKNRMIRLILKFNKDISFSFYIPNNSLLNNAVQVRSGEVLALPVARITLIVFTTIWLIGFALILFWQIYSFLKIKKYILSAITPVTDESTLKLLESLRTKLAVKREVSAFVCLNINSPVTMGVFSPIIILPNTRFEDKKLQYILEHELTHIKHHDFIIRLCAVFVSSLHWFNPISYILLNEIGVVSEYFCDENVVLNLDEKQRAVYGHMILDVSTQNIINKRPGKVLISSFGNYNKKAMKARLSNMKSIKKTKTGMRILSGVIGLAITMMSMLTVFAYEEPKRIEGNNVRAESLANVSGTFTKKADNANRQLGSVGVEVYFVNSKGEIREVTGYITNDNERACKHIYEEGEYVMHTSYSNGGCKEEYYDATCCISCGKVVLGSKTNTITYTKCIH